MSGVEQLVSAIIVQAARDFMAAARVLKKHPEKASAQADLSEMEQFFLSDWFNALSATDGKQILIRLRREAGL